MNPIIEGECEAVVHQAFAHHPLADTSFVQELDRAPFEQPRADPRLHVAARAALDHDRIDSLPMQ